MHQYIHTFSISQQQQKQHSDSNTLGNRITASRLFASSTTFLSYALALIYSDDNSYQSKRTEEKKTPLLVATKREQNLV